MTRNLRLQAGFTLLEIMIVVVIIVLLLGFAVTKMGGNIDVAKKVRTQADIQSLGTQLMLYQNLSGTLPSSEQGLKALVTRPSSDPRPRGWQQLLEEVPKDGWGHEFHYISPGVHNPNKYDLLSDGLDGKPGTEDDIGNWKQE